MAVAERAFGDAAPRLAQAERSRVRSLALPLVEAAVGLAIFAIALFVYNATLTPSLSYVSLDGNELATVPYQLGLAHPTGYPLYTWVGKAFTYLPFGDYAHRVNLMSAAGAAGGSALLFAIVVMLVRGSLGQSSGRAVEQSGSRRSWSERMAPLLPLAAGAVAALMLAFSKTLWSQAVIAEVYAPNVFMVGLCFALILVWAGYERRRIIGIGRGNASEVEIAAALRLDASGPRNDRNRTRLDASGPRSDTSGTRSNDSGPRNDSAGSPRRNALTRQYEPDAKSLALFGAFALAFGLSLGTHMSNLALAPGFVAFILLTNWRLALQPKFVLAGALGFGLGVLQFLWLPYKASHVNDAALARNTPNDLHGIYNYTLNAFPQLHWSFPWSQVPDRVVMYMDFMRANFFLTGMALAAIGRLAMAWRHPRAFFLFAPAYIFEVAFFIEYRATDIDVFFITAHFITAVFVGYGIWVLGELALSAMPRLRPHPPSTSSGRGPAPSLRQAQDAAPQAERGRERGSRGDGQRGFAAMLEVTRLQSERPVVRAWGGRLGLAAMGMVAAFVVAQPAISLARNWSETDQSANTGINDFYENVFATLPQNATLVGRGGVFGYDMFYWRYVYDVRPDVTIPLAVRFDNTRVPAGSASYTITPPGGQGGFGGPSPAPRGLQSQNAWYWPVMSAPVVTEDTAALELQRQLTLFEAHSQAPQMFVSGVTPQNEVNYSFGSVTLIGYDVDSTSVDAGGTVHLKLYWRTTGNTAPQVATKVGDTKYFEAHQLGFGNLSRYLQADGQPSSGSLLVEDYDLVVLSSLDRGSQAFSIRVANGGFGASSSAWVQIGTLEVK